MSIQQRVPGWIVIFAWLMALFSVITAYIGYFGVEASFTDLDLTIQDHWFVTKSWDAGNLAIGLALAFAALRRKGAFISGDYPYLGFLSGTTPYESTVSIRGSADLWVITKFIYIALLVNVVLNVQSAMIGFLDPELGPEALGTAVVSVVLVVVGIYAMRKLDQ